MLRTLAAIEYMRPMRGLSRTHLVMTEDGGYAVVKLCGTKNLAHEVLGRRLAEHFGVLCAKQAIVSFSSKFVTLAREPAEGRGRGREALRAGFHFGSIVPCDPEKVAIYDLLPGSAVPEFVKERDWGHSKALWAWWGSHPMHRIYFRLAPKIFSSRLIDFHEGFADRSEALAMRPFWGLSPDAAGSQEQLGQTVEAIHQLTWLSLTGLETGIPAEWWNDGCPHWTELRKHLVAQNATLDARLAASEANDLIEVRRRHVQAERGTATGGAVLRRA